MNLAGVIDRVAAFDPRKVAIRFDGCDLAYGALAERVAQAAGALAEEFGVRAGDRVALLALNHPDTLVLLYACARLGAMLLPLNWRLAVPELSYILEHAEPRLRVVDRHFAHHVSELAAAAAAVLDLDGRQAGRASLEAAVDRATPLRAGEGRFGDALLLVYTSGTTGRPKGALLSQEALLWNGAMSQHMHGLTSADHVLTMLPFFHVGGLNIQTTPALHHGATVTIHPRFEPAAALAAIGADDALATPFSPLQLQVKLRRLLGSGAVAG